MRYTLNSTDGMHSFELREGATVTLGRAPTSDIAVIDPTISRRHAEIQWDRSGVVVRDLGSSNGTFVNGTRTETAQLSAGDLLTFGKVAFRLQESTTPVSGPSVRSPA